MDSDSTTTQLITLIGVILSFSVGAIGLWISIKNSKKTIYINSVTASRIKYIQNLRDTISNFCGYFYQYSLLTKQNQDLSKEKIETLNLIDRFRYSIKLQLNPMDGVWNKKIMTLVDEIRIKINDNPAKEIDELICISQYLLNMEWKRIKLEAKKGSLNENEQNNLSAKTFQLYQEFADYKKK